MQEREAEVAAPADASQPPTSSAGGFAAVSRTEIRQLLPFDIAPHRFHRIEVRRVPGESLDEKPVALPGEVHRHVRAFVRGHSVPDHKARLSSTLSLQMVQEGYQFFSVVVVGRGLEEHATPRAIPSVGERCADRHLVPVEGMNQDGRFAPGCPGPADRRALRDAAFVLEGDPGPQTAGFFFTAGQRSETHCRTCVAWRSRARFAGRCSVHAMARSSFHPCP